jgi:beta-lactamase regulating signal transducer with metallopeptidase domain
MSSLALQQVAIVSGVTTLAALFVAVARVPLRGTLGARAAYWLWLAVPASAAALALPRLAGPAGIPTAIAPDVFGWMWARWDGLFAAIPVSGALRTVACAVWATGAAAALAVTGLRQRSFARSLGTLVPLPDGTWRSPRVIEPLLIGAWRPRLLLPLDFEARYDAEEREFVLAHERAHVRRGDTLVNALGAAWLCIFWFNPVMFWANRLLRFDQDLACDAAVLSAAGNGRRGRYAETLLKAQLAGQGALSLPLACHWRSIHPLRRRIAALRSPVAGRMRHGLGTVCAALLVGWVSLAAHALQPSPGFAGPVGPRGAAKAGATPGVHASGKVCPLALRRARELLQARAKR